MATASSWSLGLEDEHRPLVKGASSASAASPPPAGGSSVAGYAAAASLRASGVAHPAQLVVAPRAPSAQLPSRWAHIVVQRAPQRSGGLNAPLQHTPQHLWRPLEGAQCPTGVMSFLQPFAERDCAPLRAEGVQQLRPCSGFSEWLV